MKSALNLSLFLFALFTFSDKSLSLSEYKIKSICKNEKNKSTCIKNLQNKKSNLQKGNIIEIPIQPYRK